MKKILFVLVILVLLLSLPGLQAQASRIDDIEGQIRLLLDRVSPSLVKVTAENGRKYVASGIVLEDGMVITSAQVTKRPFSRLSVLTSKGELIAARIAGRDDRSGLVLLRVDKKGLPPLPPAPAAEVGNWVALVGLFYDQFPAIAQGIVSSGTDNELILNAPVAPGAAGGAVVNKNGELLGVIRGSVGFATTPDLTFKDHTTAIVVSGSRSQSGSLCYAIPVGQVRRAVEKLKRTGKIVPGWLGIVFAEATNQVQETVKGSPAARAGISGGDAIVKLAGKPVENWRDISAALAFRYAGDKVDVAFRRGGRVIQRQVVLGDRSQAAPPSPPSPPAAPEFTEWAERLAELPAISELDTLFPKARNFVIEISGARRLGIDVMEIGSDLGRKFSVSEGYGLLVSGVAAASAAAKAGLLAGDVLVRAGERPLRSAADLRLALDSLAAKEPLLLALYRDGRPLRLSIVPQQGAPGSWNLRRFSQRVEELQGGLGEEVLAQLQEEIRKLSQAKDQALAELQKEKRLSLKRASEQSRRLAQELKRLEAEKEKLSAEARRRYAGELQAIQEQLRRIEALIAAEKAGKQEEK